MTVRFLLFRGSWENEGNFCLLESDDSIIILATGKDFATSAKQEQQIGEDYLKEKKAKVKAIIVNNTNFRNINLLEEVCRCIGSNIPIYSSYPSKIIILNHFPTLKNRIVAVDKEKEIQLDDFRARFLPLSSYLAGNLAVKLDHSNFSFYFIEGIVSSNLLDNKLLAPRNFHHDLHQFLQSKQSNSCLITSFQGIHWRNSNSLFFALKNLPDDDNKSLVFVLYDFDWLHLLELLEIVRKWKKKIRIIDKDFLALAKKLLSRDSLSTVIARENDNSSQIYLMTGNPDNLRQKLTIFLDSNQIVAANTNFIVCTPPFIGGESKLANLLDFLYSHSDHVLNLSKKEYLSLGTSFYDLKLLLQVLNPQKIIALQNSYRHSRLISYLPDRVTALENGYALEFPTKQLFRLRTKKTLISLEELLVRQRQSLQRTGMLVILLVIGWEKQELKIKKLQIQSLAMSSSLNLAKLEGKIKSWWESKLIRGITHNDNSKTVKKIIERRINEKINTYLNLEHDINLEESLVLIFNNSKSHNSSHEKKTV